MEQGDLEQIDKFLGIVGKNSLFDYYQMNLAASDDAAHALIRKRRSWAQGQQANPKYRTEAMWLIKHNALLRRVLLENRDAYQQLISDRTDTEVRTSLSLFIQGTLATGVLTIEGERAIMERGQQFGLDRQAIEALVETGLAEAGAFRQGEDRGGNDGGFLDFYELLGVSPSATFEAIEQAHRGKYREARSLRDKRKAEQIYQQLDRAWRALKDPGGRADYDTMHRQYQGADRSMGAENLQFTPDYSAPSSLDRAARGPSTAPKGEIRLDRIDVKRGSADRGEPGPPRPPQGLTSRSLGLAPGPKPTSRPRLAIASPELVQVKVIRKPVTHRIVIKNTGQGRMAGRVASDREWLRVEHSRLDQNAEEQIVQVVIHPREMPRHKSVALVTIITDHGERRAITFRVERRPIALPAVGVLVLILAALVFTPLATNPPWGRAEPVADMESVLIVEVNPGADRIDIDGEVRGAGSRIRLNQDLPLGEAFPVTVEMEGFHPMTRELTLEPGEIVIEHFVLEMIAIPRFKPNNSAERGEMSSDIARKAINKRRRTIERCFLDNLSDRPGEAEMTISLYVGKFGRMEGVSLLESNFPDRADLIFTCTVRQLMVVNFPIIQADYVRLEHTFRFQIEEDMELTIEEKPIEN